MNNQTESVPVTKAAAGRNGFFIHLAAFLVVNALLIFVNFATSSGHLWFQWPLLGWSIGIIFHALAAFGVLGVKDRHEKRP